MWKTFKYEWPKVRNMSIKPLAALLLGVSLAGCATEFEVLEAHYGGDHPKIEVLEGERGGEKLMFSTQILRHGEVTHNGESYDYIVLRDTLTISEGYEDTRVRYDDTWVKGTPRLPASTKSFLARHIPELQGRDPGRVMKGDSFRLDAAGSSHNIIYRIGVGFLRVDHIFKYGR